MLNIFLHTLVTHFKLGADAVGEDMELAVAGAHCLHIALQLFEQLVDRSVPR